MYESMFLGSGGGEEQDLLIIGICLLSLFHGKASQASVDFLNQMNYGLE